MSTSPAPRVSVGLSCGLRLAADIVLRYGLVLIILWFGAFKFTAAEARAIQPLVSNSPILAWLYVLTDVRGASRVIGTAEVVIALLIALRPIAPRLSALGSLAAIGMFATTLSFLASTPGVWIRVDGFLVPNEIGAFLLKDLFLLGAALLTASDALEATRLNRNSHPAGTVLASA